MRVSLIQRRQKANRLWRASGLNQFKAATPLLVDDADID